MEKEEKDKIIQKIKDIMFDASYGVYPLHVAQEMVIEQVEKLLEITNKKI